MSCCVGVGVRLCMMVFVGVCRLFVWCELICACLSLWRLGCVGERLFVMGCVGERRW